IMNGMADYLNMLNERDGGIGGVKILVEACETGYDTQKGVERYEQVKSKNPVVINPYSTGITLQIIPKAALAKDYGFELKLYPVPAAEMQNQSSQWLNIRRDRPDWIYIQGFGTMNPTAVKEAAKNNYPMDHLIGNWWAGSDDDARPAGDAAKGYL